MSTFKVDMTSTEVLLVSGTGKGLYENPGVSLHAS